MVLLTILIKNLKLPRCHDSSVVDCVWVLGFVSYDNILSAQVAIQNLNGYHIGGKKLKVELKRKKGYSVAKPY